ncbi:hypothetical protein DDB_G0289023 [Dictyostelium discoideum AX4]|uniref:FNIP repeat-containing protein n=1 Tax=Dictyostelium discoideum TaxID=44689 RepID=Q54I42_DICDI|nr:hypothetical protein DDB_G0289023 [Dictyostelium discoideum AX4]EAL62927.1 hypothetical protein DDB_G0289023 [Dictyostelium discoideum AX4]|eukprot:XP_636429.1 hypothetical protein DDB_G0289023 [Dictyostelium discoideum AX4]
MILNYNYFRIENNNNNNNKFEDLNKLFFKIWRNLIIRNEILENVRKFKRFEKLPKICVSSYYIENENRYFYKRVLINGSSKKEIIEKLSYLPHTVEELTIEYKSIEDLPTSKISNTTYFIPPFITTLIFENSIQDSKIAFNFIPPTIKKLILPIYFNQPLRNTINESIFPMNSSLESIDFGESFNKNLYDLPKSLKQIKLSKDFNLKLNKNSIPKNVKEIEFGSKYSKLIANNVLPPCAIVKKAYTINYRIQIYKAYEKVFIPNWTKSLILGPRCNVDLLPNLYNLKINYLSLNCKGYSDLSNISKCNSIRYIKFGENFSQSISINDLPPKLVSLYFSKSFYQTITKSMLPKNLNFLYLKSDNIDIEFPLNMKYLAIFISKNNKYIINKINEDPNIIKENKIHIVL